MLVVAKLIIVLRSDILLIKFLSFVSQNAYLPTMPDDNLEEAIEGMSETGSWYRK